MKGSKGNLHLNRKDDIIEEESLVESVRSRRCHSSMGSSGEDSYV